LRLDINTDGDPDHENLAILMNLAIAAQLKQSLTSAGVLPSKAWPLVETAVFELAIVFDQGKIVVNGKAFSPKIAFVDNDGRMLPGALKFNRLHEYASVFEDELKSSEGFSIQV